MHDFGAKGLACTPSYALYLAETIHNSGIPLEEFQLRVGAFGAEPWTENMRKELEQKLNIKAYDIYGLTEICGPGVVANANARTVPTCGKTISSRKSSIRSLCNLCLKVNKASWYSPL